jgi:hypothetical protein
MGDSSVSTVVMYCKIRPGGVMIARMVRAWFAHGLRMDWF